MDQAIEDEDLSEVQVVSDLEEYIEDLFKWTLTGLTKYLKKNDLLNKNSTNIIQRVISEQLKNLESKLESDAKKSDQETETRCFENNGVSVSGESKETAHCVTEMENSRTLTSKNQDETEGDQNSIEFATPTDDIAAETISGNQDTGLSNLINVDLGNDNDNSFAEEAIIQSTIYTAMEELEEGELSCSTADNESVEVGEKDIVADVNSVLNSLKNRKSPSIIKDLFASTLKIRCMTTAAKFVDKIFKKCLEDKTVSNSLADLIEISQSIGKSDQHIPDELKSWTWSKCRETFKVIKDEVPLNFVFSKNPEDIEKGICITSKYHQIILQRDNIIFLVGDLFHRELIGVRKLAPFVCKLLEIAIFEDHTYFGFLCTLLTIVGEHFEDKLKSDNWKTILKGKNGTENENIPLHKLMNAVIDNMNQSMNIAMPEVYKERIQGLHLLWRNNWKLNAQPTPSSSATAEKPFESVSNAPNTKNSGARKQFQGKRKNVKSTKTFRPKNSRQPRTKNHQQLTRKSAQSNSRANSNPQNQQPGNVDLGHLQRTLNFIQQLSTGQIFGQGAGTPEFQQNMSSNRSRRSPNAPQYQNPNVALSGSRRRPNRRPRGNKFRGQRKNGNPQAQEISEDPPN